MRILALTLCLTASLTARADDAPLTATDEGRRAYLEGVELVKKAQWAEALAAFERSALLRPHATTTFSIGACERALGRQLRARASFKLALSQSAANDNQMPAELGSDAQAFIGEIDRLLAHVEVHLDPPQTEITVDGRPLQSEAHAYPLPILVAGMLPPGPGRAPPSGFFELLVEPGAHVIMLSRKGYSNAVVNRTWAPGARTVLPLELARLPAILHITSNQPEAVVAVDDHDVGAVPAEVARPAGSYSIVAHKKGFQTYRTRVTVEAGQQLDLQAPLSVEKTPLVRQWWFWTATLASVTVLAVGLGVGLMPPPSYDGGSTGWVARSR